MWRTETRKRVTKRETKKSRLVSLPVCGKVCWESRCLWFRQVSNSGNSQINSQEFKESKKLTIETVNDWFFVYSLSLVFAHLCLTLLDFRRVFVTATVFFSFAPKDASFWRPLSVLQYLHGVQWWTARCWMESDVLPHPHDPGKERKGMEPRAMKANVESLGSKCTGAMMPSSRRWDDMVSLKITDLEAWVFIQ